MRMNRNDANYITALEDRMRQGAEAERALRQKVDMLESSIHRLNCEMREHQSVQRRARERRLKIIREARDFEDLSGDVLEVLRKLEVMA